MKGVIYLTQPILSCPVLSDITECQRCLIGAKFNAIAHLLSVIIEIFKID